MGLSTEQKAELFDIYPKIKTGVADSTNTTARMIRLHNIIYGTGYKPNTNCRSCLSTVFKNIKKLYEQNI